jgi:integrase
VTAPLQVADRSGLLAKLMAAVRPEFRAKVFLPDPTDAILGSPACWVPDCDRRQQYRRLCDGHYKRWKQRGRPDLDTFIRMVEPVTGHGPMGACAVSGCGYGRASQGLCRSHHDRWQRAGSPALSAWLASVASTDAPDRPTCRVASCPLWAQPRSPLCRGHHVRWHSHGYPDIEAFVAVCAAAGPARFDFRALGERAQVRLELQYALQCRSDEQRVRTRPWMVQPVIAFVAGTQVTSLLDWSLEQWTGAFLQARRERQRSSQLAFLRHAHTRLRDLHEGGGWEAEFPRDSWELRRLGVHGNAARLRFDRIPQPWLRELGKRWVRWRLSTGLSVAQAVIDVLALTRFAAFLASSSVPAERLADLSRAVLEGYLAHLAASGRPAKARGKDLSSLSAFLTAIRQHHWEATLPASAVIYREDYPKPDRDPLARALAEQVMAQVEQPANLEKFADPARRLVTVIMIRAGLRVGDATRLAVDCLVRDAGGASYLRYVNHKMRREALVPIDDELAEQLRAQQQRVRARYPAGAPVLFPRQNANPDGSQSLPTSTYQAGLRRWLASCDIRDEHGQPVRLTAHQWRHTFATRLINRDVPQEVVRVLLDHETPAMTAHYARLSDQTVRRHWEQARKVNIHGQRVTIDPDGPVADAAWAKHRVGLATQALPNGYCGLPVQQTCPHANACLTCPVFITTPEFLDQHCQHREQTRRLLATATANGQLRLAEMNQQVLGNLDRIIAALDADPQPPPAQRQEAPDAG